MARRAAKKNEEPINGIVPAEPFDPPFRKSRHGGVHKGTKLLADLFETLADANYNPVAELVRIQALALSRVMEDEYRPVQHFYLKIALDASQEVMSYCYSKKRPTDVQNDDGKETVVDVLKAIMAKDGRDFSGND